MGLLDIALRPAAGALAVGRAATRTATGAATDASLAALDALLRSRLAIEAVERVLESELARATVARALEGPLVEAVAEEVVRLRVAERLLAGPLADELARDVARLRVVERVAGELLTAEVVAGLLERSDAVALPQLVAMRIFDDERLLDALVERLLTSPALWQLVDEIAQSPAVTAAITAQSAGFADEVAGGLRARSRRADLWLEGAARKALRRPRPESS